MDAGELKKLLKVIKGGKGLDSKIEGAVVNTRAGTTPQSVVKKANDDAAAEFIFSDGVPSYGTTPRSMVQEANDAATREAEEYLRSEGITPPVRGRDLVNDARSAGLPAMKPKTIRVQNPFDDKEVFQFPEGTDERNAKEMVRMLLLKRAREGEMTIEMPSKLPDERTAELERANAKIEELQQKIKDLDERPGMNKLSAGVWQDENTGRYWQIDGDGKISEWQPD